MKLKLLDGCLWVTMVLVATACTYAGDWTVLTGRVAQGSGFVEVLPAEDMDGHAITWGPSGHVRFYPSWNWDTPQPGDEVCWLYGQSGVTWWQGVFNNPSTVVDIQFGHSDSNDGWADIYVDGVLEFSINTLNRGWFTVRGTDLAPTAHTVEIQTRASGRDLSFDYVAIPSCVVATAPSPEIIANAHGDPVVNIKNRVLSFAGADAGRAQAVRVTFVDLPVIGLRDFSVYNGTRWWADIPGEYSESPAAGYDEPCRVCDGGTYAGEICTQDVDCIDAPCAASICSGDTFISALLTTRPVFRDWSADGIVHLRDELIIPLGSYRIEIVDATCNWADPANYSPPIQVCKDGTNNGQVCTSNGDCPAGLCVDVITNGRWSDTVELAAGEWRAAATVCASGVNVGVACTTDTECPFSTCGVVSVFDTLAILYKFTGERGAPSKVRADLQGTGAAGYTPIVDGVIDVGELNRVLGAFGGDLYPYPPP